VEIEVTTWSQAIEAILILLLDKPALSAAEGRAFESRPPLRA
jgi:hypothetical protein